MYVIRFIGGVSYWLRGLTNTLVVALSNRELSSYIACEFSERGVLIINIVILFKQVLALYSKSECHRFFSIYDFRYAEIVKNVAQSL